MDNTSKTKDNTRTKNKNTLNSWLIGAMIAIALIFGFSMFFIVHGSSGPDNPVSIIKIEYVDKDSISDQGERKVNKYVIVNRNFADSVVSRINRQEEELARNYNLFMEARKDDADIVKILSCIGGFILAIFALYGIKSYKDLQDKLLSEAKSKADITVTEYLNIEIPNLIGDKVNQSIAKNKIKAQLKKEITRYILRKHIVELEQKVNDLESTRTIDNDLTTSDTQDTSTESKTQKHLDHIDEVNLNVPPEAFETNKHDQSPS